MEEVAISQQIREASPALSVGIISADVMHLAEEIELALEKVREEYRRAFLLFHERHLNYEQISQVLDCPLGTVKTWVHRARKGIVSQLRARGVIHEQRHAVRRA